jgi:hypothetical protein
MSFGRVGCTLRAVGVRQSSFLGLTVDEEMTEHGPWFSVSVFWSPDVPVSRLPTRLNELIRLPGISAALRTDRSGALAQLSQDPGTSTLGRRLKVTLIGR